MLEVLLGSKVRARLLEWLFMHPDDSYYVRQLGELLGLDPTNVSRELNRLLELGVLSVRMSGNQKHFSVNQNSSIYRDLLNIVIKIEVVPGTIMSALETSTGRIEVAFIYGSLANGQMEKESDIDS